MRDEQREATRQRILDVAVEALVTGGLAACTTVQVQRRAGVSRGALLHHFSTRAELFGAAIRQLVVLNEAAVRGALATALCGADAVERALRALYGAYTRPAFGAELELWAAARTDTELRAALRQAEHDAQRDLHRVVDEAFGPELTGLPAFRVVAALTVEFMRGLAVTASMRTDARRGEALLGEWIRLVRHLLGQPEHGRGMDAPGAIPSAPGVPAGDRGHGFGDRGVLHSAATG